MIQFTKFLCLSDHKTRRREEYGLGVLGSTLLTPVELRGILWPRSSESGLTIWLPSYALSLEIFTEAGLGIAREFWNIPGIREEDDNFWG